MLKPIKEHKTSLEILIEYGENILKDSTINAHLIIGKAKLLLQQEKELKDKV